MASEFFPSYLASAATSVCGFALPWFAASLSALAHCATAAVETASVIKIMTMMDAGKLKRGKSQGQIVIFTLWPDAKRETSREKRPH
jgi:hypothetical protein